MKRVEKKWLLEQLLGVVATLGLLSMSLARIPFYTRGEGREAIAAVSVWQGNIILPRGYGDVVASKPPLLHWLIAGFSYFASYPSEFACRVPSLIFGMGALGLLLWTFHRLGDLRRGVVVCALCVTMFEWVRSALSCRVDMVHAATMAASLLIWFLIRDRVVRGGGWHGVGIFLMTLSVLAKGPVAIIIPALVFVVWFIIHERPQGSTFFRLVVPALLWCATSVAIAASWYLLAYRAGGDAFWDRIWYENISRFAGTMEDNPHAHGPLYLVGQLLLGTMPWSLVIGLAIGSSYRRNRNGAVAAVAVRAGIADTSAMMGARSVPVAEASHTAVNRLYRWVASILTRICPQGVRTGWGQLQPLEQFALVVVVVVCCFYEIPRGKRGVYLLPAYPFLAILGVRMLLHVSAQRALGVVSRVIGATTIGGGLVLLFAGCGSILFDVDVTGTGSWFYPLMGVLKESLLSGSLFAPLAMAGAVALSWASMQTPSLEEGEAAPHYYQVLNLARAMLGLILFAQGVVQPAIASRWSERIIAERMEGVVTATDRIVSWNQEFYGVSFYLRRPIFRADPTPKLGEVCILPAEDLDELRQALSPPLQPIPVVLIKRGILPGDTVLVVKIESPGSGLGAV